MFDVGIFMGWADVSNENGLPWSLLIPIFLGGCLWTIAYETVYQYQVLIFFPILIKSVII